jgi:NADH:ubiquinone oxidoreductase subunit 6 (subunit J)
MHGWFSQEVIVILALIVVAAAIVCAVQALRSCRLLVSALWLAGTSAMVALLLYMLGAHEVAVVELSVGAGLVTILFVFAISVAGEEAIDVRTFVPKPLAIGLVAVATLLMASLVMRQPVTAVEQPANGNAVTDAVTDGVTAFADVLWQQRGLDVLVQVVMIFSGVLGMLGLLADTKATKDEGRTTKETTIPAMPTNGNGHQVVGATGVFFDPKPKFQNQQSEGVRQ